MDKKDKFICDMCGECCKHIENIPQLSSFDNGKGECIHLKNNICEIYNTRPDICNVDKMYDMIYHSEYPSKQAYYEANMSACEALKSKYLKESNQ